MKIAYILRNNMASTFQLCSMILPQLEIKSHGFKVVGMMFFDDNSVSYTHLTLPTIYSV